MVQILLFLHGIFLDFWVAKEIRKGDFRESTVYCYEDGALETFKAAKKKGIKCVYELPIGYWKSAQEIFEEETDLNPDWSDTISRMSVSARKLGRKNDEILLADHIVVPSSFVVRTLEGVELKSDSISIVPYGAPKPVENLTKDYKSKRIRILYVGSLTQRKGISYLFDAMKEFANDEVELTLIGRRTARCKVLDDELNNYRWIETLSHDKVLDEMKQHDVLVFPSLFDGFGLVILEAMSRGLPVITTMNTAGADIVKDGVNGFIVPIRSSGAIAEKIRLLVKDGELRKALSENALKTAGLNSWESYRDNLRKALEV